MTLLILHITELLALARDNYNMQIYKRTYRRTYLKCHLAHMTYPIIHHQCHMVHFNQSNKQKSYHSLKLISNLIKCHPIYKLV